MAGIQQLGYLGFQVSDLAAWESFATNVLGLAKAAFGANGRFSLRMDSYANRIFVDSGPADDLAFIGWQVADEAAVEEMAKRIRSTGIAVEYVSGDEAGWARGVRGKMIRFVDPGGIPSEIFNDMTPGPGAFNSALVPKGFVAEELGLGHLVISANNQAESLKFYTEVMGFRLSDHIVTSVYGYPVNIAFLHANARHHSLAIGGPQKKRLHHFMLEVKLIDDVGLCLDRTWRSGLKIMQTLGRHPNDRMFSFYAKTPSGFQFEYGWGGREVDDATWEPTTYDHISEWGHQPPQFVAQPPPGVSKP